MQRLASREMLAGDFSVGSVAVACDVNVDGSITSLDALQVINRLWQSPADGENTPGVSRRFDVNGDGEITANDALWVINRLSRGEDGPLTLEDVAPGLADRLDDAQQERLQQLFERLNAIRLDVDIAPERITNFLRDVAETSQALTPLSPETLEQLGNSFQSALGDGVLTPDEFDTLSDTLLTTLEEAQVPTEVVERLREHLAAFSDILAADPEVPSEWLDRFREMVDDFRSNLPLLGPATGDTDPATPAEWIGGVTGWLENLSFDPSQIDDWIDQLPASELPIATPDFDLVQSLVSDIRDARADGEIDSQERDQILAGVDDVLENNGVALEQRDRILIGIDRWWDRAERLRDLIGGIVDRDAVASSG